MPTPRWRHVKVVTRRVRKSGRVLDVLFYGVTSGLCGVEKDGHKNLEIELK